MENEKQFFEKLDTFFDILSQCENCVIAYSGGVDSTLLAKAAQKIMLEKVACVLLVSPLLTEDELNAARKTIKDIGLPLFELKSEETGVPEFVQNDADRCYYCKKYRMGVIGKWAKEHGYVHILEGSNIDDLFDYRPGMKALKEFKNVRSPLLESGLNKLEIRDLAKQWGVPVWDKPSLPCLATRLKYGTPITLQELDRLQHAEKIIASYCPANCNIRVRVYENLARIEVDRQYLPLLTKEGDAEKINKQLKELGFSFVTVDLAGFKSGSMNEEIVKKANDKV